MHLIVQVVVVDEIGTQAEAQAIKTFGHRRTTVICTAHGNTLADVLNIPELACLMGGKNTVIMGEGFARCHIRAEYSNSQFRVSWALTKRDSYKWGSINGRLARVMKLWI
jgi:stage III sporulation protein SpoIIIAA